MSKFKDEVTGEVKNIVISKETKCIGCDGHTGLPLTKCNNTMCLHCWYDAEGADNENDNFYDR